MDVEANRKVEDDEEETFLSDEDVTSSVEAAPIKLKGIVKEYDKDDGSAGLLSNFRRRMFILVFASLTLVTASYFAFVGRSWAEENQCPGDLVPKTCPCTKRCTDIQASEPVVCPRGEECAAGCGCPKDKPFLLGTDQCVSSCPRCPQEKPKASQAPLTLYVEDNHEIGQLRVGPAEPCNDDLDSKIVDVFLHFTVIVNGSDCSVDIPPYEVAYFESRYASSASPVGCLNMNTADYDTSIRGAWFFFTARLWNLPEDTSIDYQIGLRETGLNKKSPIRHLVSPLAPGSVYTGKPILVIGDTASSGVHTVGKSASASAEDTGYSLVIHVGDSSYATNKGDCYNDDGKDPLGRCGYDCQGTACHGADKVQSAEMLDLYKWNRIVDDTLGGKSTWVTTMGNHDNDIGWFLTFRPPLVGAMPGVQSGSLPWTVGEHKPFLSSAVSNAEKQALAMKYMKEPHFYSFDHGLMHVIEIGTEDNPMNAYETWKGEPHSEKLKERFDRHFGKNSKQYNWLKTDLQQAVNRRSIAPWIVIFTHRPMFHTAQHHEWCAKGGDWYGCMFVETYEPLLREFGVNLFIAGHSHHYQRSLPMHNQEVRDDGTVHLIVGVGGYDVVGEHWVRTPKWLASRQGTKLGYARFWVTNATSMYWEHVGAEDGKVLDSAWFANRHAVVANN